MTKLGGSTNNISSGIYDQISIPNEYASQNLSPPLHQRQVTATIALCLGAKAAGCLFGLGRDFFMHLMRSRVWVVASNFNCDDSSQIVFRVWVMHAWTLGWSLAVLPSDTTF